MIPIQGREDKARPWLQGLSTHPLCNGAATGALPLLPGVDDLLDPDGFPLLSVPREGDRSHHEHSRAQRRTAHSRRYSSLPSALVSSYCGGEGREGEERDRFKRLFSAWRLQRPSGQVQVPRLCFSCSFSTPIHLAPPWSQDRCSHTECPVITSETPGRVLSHSYMQAFISTPVTVEPP